MQIIQKLLVFLLLSTFTNAALSQESCHLPSSKILQVRKHKSFSYCIPSNLGTGSQWMLLDSSFVRVVSRSSKTNPDQAQSTDIQIFQLKCIKRGNATLVFYNARPFDKAIDTANAQKITQKLRIR